MKMNILEIVRESEIQDDATVKRKQRVERVSRIYERSRSFYEIEQRG